MKFFELSLLNFTFNQIHSFFSYPAMGQNCLFCNLFMSFYEIKQIFRNYSCLCSFTATNKFSGTFPVHVFLRNKTNFHELFLFCRFKEKKSNDHELFLFISFYEKKQMLWNCSCSCSYTETKQMFRNCSCSCSLTETKIFFRNCSCLYRFTKITNFKEHFLFMSFSCSCRFPETKQMFRNCLRCLI